MPTEIVTQKAGVVDPDDLIVSDACCCTIQSCYLKCPECCGCYTSGTVCCCTTQAMGCKPSNVKGETCILCEGGETCIYPTTCCKGTSQFCCYDTRCAFPCDHDVPCVLASCCIVCCYNSKPQCGFCHKLGHYVKVKTEDGKVPHSSPPSKQQKQQPAVAQAYPVPSPQQQSSVALQKQAYSEPYPEYPEQSSSYAEDTRSVGRSSYDHNTGRPSADGRSSYEGARSPSGGHPVRYQISAGSKTNARNPLHIAARHK